MEARTRMTVVGWMVMVLMTAGILSAQHAMAEVQLDFLPSTIRIHVGERKLVAIVARNVPNPGLAAFQFTVQFDPAAIAIENPNEAVRSQGVEPFAPLGGHPLCTTARNTDTTCPDPPWLLTTTGRSPFGIDRINNNSGRVRVAYGTSGTPMSPTKSGTVALVEMVGVAVGTTVVRLAEVIVADHHSVPRAFPVVRGTLTAVVVPLNTAPVAQNQSPSTPEDTALPIALTATDAEGDALTFIVLTAPAHGTLQGTPPALTYQPVPNFYGRDRFTFRASDGILDSNVATVRIEVTPVNDPPEAMAQEVMTSEDVAVRITLQATDVDVPTTLHFAIAANPGHGTLTGTAPNLRYQPNVNFHGTDRFTFRVNDGIDNSNVAKVILTVKPMNDPPAVRDRTVTTDEDVPIAIRLRATDEDDNTLTFAIVTPPGHGTLQGTPPAVTYTPTANFHGTDRLTFKAKDGKADSKEATITVVVRPVNDPPQLDPIGPQSVQEGKTLRLLLIATDPDGDTLSFNAGNMPTGATLTDQGDGTATFLWKPGFQTSGNYQVIMTVTDNGSPMASDFEEITITVGNVNRPPVLKPIGPKRVLEGALLSFRMSASDPDGDRFTWKASGLPDGATLTVLENNRTARFDWTPGFDDGGNVVVRFIVTDRGTPREKDFEDVTIIVGSVNRPPVLTPLGNQTVDKSTMKTVPVTSSDPGGDSLSLTASNLPAFATFTDNGDGTGLLTLTPRRRDVGVYPDVTLMATDTGTPPLSASESLAITVSIAAAPEAPGELTAQTNQAEVTLQWSAVGGATHFRIFRRLHGESQFAEIGRHHDMLYADQLPQETVSATYFVVAENPFGTSPASATITVTPEAQ